MKKIVIGVLTVALLVPTVALAGNKNRFEGDGTSKHDKKVDVTFRLSGNEKKIEDFRARDFKFKCKGDRNDFKSNWIKFDKKFKVKKKNGEFDGNQKETDNGVTLKGKAKGRLDGKKKDYDEAHGSFHFEVDAPTYNCKSGKIKWEADR